MQKQEIDKKLQTLKKELARKQKKLQKCLRREKVKAHVRQKIQEQENLTRQGEWSSHRVSTAYSEGTSKTKVHFEEKIVSVETQKGNSCQDIISTQHGEKVESLKQETCKVSSFRPGSISHCELESRNKEDHGMDTSVSQVDIKPCEKGNVTRCNDHKVGIDYDFQKVKQSNGPSHNSDIGSLCSHSNFRVDERNARRFCDSNDIIENRLIECGSDARDKGSDRILDAEVIQYNKTGIKSSRNDHTSSKDSSILNQTRSRTIVPPQSGCLSPIMDNTPLNECGCSDTEVILGRKLSQGKQRKSRKRIRYSLSKDKAVSVCTNSVIRKDEVMCISPIKSVPSCPDYGTAMVGGDGHHLCSRFIGAKVKERRDEQDMAFVQCPEKETKNCDTGDSKEGIGHGMIAEVKRCSGSSNENNINSNSIKKSPQSDQESTIFRGKSSVSKLNVDGSCQSVSTFDSDCNSKHITDSIGSVHTPKMSEKRNSIYNECSIGREEEKLQSNHKKRAARKKKNSFSELSSLDFSFLDDNGHDLYSQVKSRCRRRSRQSTCSGDNGLSSQSISSVTQVLLSQNSQQDDEYYDKPLVLPKCGLGMSQKHNILVASPSSIEAECVLGVASKDEADVIKDGEMLGGTEKEQRNSDVDVGRGKEELQILAYSYTEGAMEQQEILRKEEDFAKTNIKKKRSRSHSKSSRGNMHSSEKSIQNEIDQLDIVVDATGRQRQAENLSCNSQSNLKGSSEWSTFSGTETGILCDLDSRTDFKQRRLKRAKKPALKFPVPPQEAHTETEFSLPLKDYGTLVQKRLGESSSEDPELNQSSLMPFLQEQSCRYDLDRPRRRSSMRRQLTGEFRHDDRDCKSVQEDSVQSSACKTFASGSERRETQSTEEDLLDFDKSHEEKKHLSSLCSGMAEQKQTFQTEVNAEVVESSKMKLKAVQKKTLGHTSETERGGSELLSVTLIERQSQQSSALKSEAYSSVHIKENGHGSNEKSGHCDENSDQVLSEDLVLCGGLEVCKHDILLELSEENNNRCIVSSTAVDTEDESQSVYTDTYVVDDDAAGKDDLTKVHRSNGVVKELCYPVKEVIKFKECIHSLDVGLISSGDHETSELEILIVALDKLIQIYTLKKDGQVEILHSLSFSEGRRPQFVKCIPSKACLFILVVSYTEDSTVLHLHSLLDVVKWVSGSQCIKQWTGFLSMDKDILVEDLLGDSFLLAECVSIVNSSLLTKYTVQKQCCNTSSQCRGAGGSNPHTFSKMGTKADSLLHSLKKVQGLSDAVVGVSSSLLYLWNSSTCQMLLRVQLPWTTYLCTSITYEEGLLFLLVWTTDCWTLSAVNPSTLKSIEVTKGEVTDQRIMDSCSYGNCILATNDLDELLCWHLNSTNRMLKHSLKKAECPCVLDQKYEKTKLLLSNLCKSLIVADCNTITFYDVCSEI